MQFRTAIAGLALFCASGFGHFAVAQSQTPSQGTDFYEAVVRPILEAHCYACHGGLEGKPVQSGFNLSTRDGLVKGGENGSAVSLEKPADSALVRAINYQELKMPPKGKLPQAQIDILTTWITMGAPWSEKTASAPRKSSPVVDERARNFWSFRPVVRPEVPTVRNSTWVRTPVDAFVAAKLESAGLEPSPAAAKTTLLRRLYYDLIGLPPTFEQVQNFLDDQAPDAYEKVVDQLLASPHYGERWARHWLDLVRYGETNSFEVDAVKPEVWRYRDYVIRSFNDDKPYDRFIREQLSGDELEPVTADSIIATGYYRLGPSDGGAPDRLQATFDELDDIVATTGQVFLGLAVNCARCHDHKIDPFPTKDYYRLLAFFRGIERGGRRVLPIDLPPDHGLTDSQIAEYQKHAAEVAAEIDKIEQALEPSLEAGERDDFAEEANRPTIVRAHFPAHVTDQILARYEVLIHERNVLRNSQPSALANALCVTEAGANSPATHILLRGNPRNEGELVEPGFPSVMTRAEPVIAAPPPDAKSSGRRKVLAEWIASPTNPLTARVIVNRLWHYHFGHGLVRSVSDYGYGGTPPTHPELLDWLASELTAEGWRLKRIHKLIVMSSTYQMSSLDRASASAKDPENDLWWRFDLRRLEAEELRDSILAVSGNLNSKLGGPSIYPKIPAVVLAGRSRPGSGWRESSPEEQNRRSIYVHVKRSLLVPLLGVFDSADTDASCPARFATTQPTQALAMLNSDFLNEQARVFAENIRGQVQGDANAQIRLVLERVTQRAPTAAEIDRGAEFFEKLEKTNGLSSDKALQIFCLLALNMNEFLYLD